VLDGSWEEVAGIFARKIAVGTDDRLFITDRYGYMYSTGTGAEDRNWCKKNQKMRGQKEAQEEEDDGQAGQGQEVVRGLQWGLRLHLPHES